MVKGVHVVDYVENFGLGNSILLTEPASNELKLQGEIFLLQFFLIFIVIFYQIP